MLANMNKSERLHNQGSREQVITPELKLSMELRDACENLLLEKGKNVIDVNELAAYCFPIVGPLPGIMRGIRNKVNNPVDNIRHKNIKLKVGYPNLRPSREGEFIEIKCPSVNPPNAKFIDVMGLVWDYSRWLRIYRNQGAEIMGYKPDKGMFGTGLGVRPIVIRKASKRELEYFKHQINQSSRSPVEHK